MRVGRDLFTFGEQNNKDVLLLGIYISWQFFGNILFLVLNKIVIRHMMETSRSARIGPMLYMIDLAVSLIDFLFLVVILSMLRSRLGKRLFIAFLLIRIALFILNKLT